MDVKSQASLIIDALRLRDGGGRGAAHIDLASLDAMMRDGAILLLKLDGQRSADNYTLVIQGGPLGDGYFRIDAPSVERAIAEGIVWYNERVWRLP